MGDIWIAGLHRFLAKASRLSENASWQAVSRPGGVKLGFYLQQSPTSKAVKQQTEAMQSSVSKHCRQSFDKVLRTCRQSQKRRCKNGSICCQAAISCPPKWSRFKLLEAKSYKGFTSTDMTDDASHVLTSSTVSLRLKNLIQYPASIQEKRINTLQAPWNQAS